MFRKILYPIDSFGSASAPKDNVRKLKQAGAQEVVILGVITLRGCEWTGRSLKECRADRFEKEKAEMEAVLKGLEENGLKGKLRIEVGRSVYTVLKVADEEEVSSIIIGTGCRDIKGLRLGRTTEEVVRHAKVSVLVVKE